MNHKERLAEIEKQIEGLSCYHYNAHQKSISYLLTRVRVLTEALEWIGEGGCTDVECWEKARKALDEANQNNEEM